MATPASWQADPTGRHEHRYWDGNQWTDNVSDGGSTSVDPYAATPAPTPPPAPPPAADAGETEPITNANLMSTVVVGSLAVLALIVLLLILTGL